MSSGACHLLIIPTGLQTLFVSDCPGIEAFLWVGGSRGWAVRVSLCHPFFFFSWVGMGSDQNELLSG